MTDPIAIPPSGEPQPLRLSASEAAERILYLLAPSARATFADALTALAGYDPGNDAMEVVAQTVAHWARLSSGERILIGAAAAAFNGARYLRLAELADLPQPLRRAVLEALLGVWG